MAQLTTGTSSQIKDHQCTSTLRKETRAGEVARAKAKCLRRNRRQRRRSASISHHGTVSKEITAP
jgi:hypothetical protein